MSRTLVIALTFSAAAHLAAAGFGPAPETAANRTGAAVLTVRLAQPAAKVPNKPVPDPIPVATATQQAPSAPLRATTRTPATPRALPEALPAPATSPRQATTPPTVNPTAVPAATAQMPSDALEQRVRQLLSGYFHYPRLARRHGWEGIVEVGLRIAADGRVSDVVLHRQSGYPTLDQAALTAAKRLGIVPEAAALLGSYGMELIVPVHYRLNQG